MEELIKKLTQLLELTKALKDPNKPLSPAIPALPAIKPPVQPSMTPPKAGQAKMPGVNPNSKKDPRKVAQQIKDGSMSTKTQKILLKFHENGQWSLEKEDSELFDEISTKKPILTPAPVNPKDPVLNNDKFPPKAISPEKLNEQKAKLDQYIKNKQFKKDESAPKMDDVEPMYHIHQGGHRITDKPLSIKEINQQHGGVKKLENSGLVLIRHHS